MAVQSVYDAGGWKMCGTEVEPTQAVREALSRLVTSGVLTGFQERELLRCWAQFDQDWHAHPFFRAIPEHAQAMIERWWKESISDGAKVKPRRGWEAAGGSAAIISAMPCASH